MEWDKPKRRGKVFIDHNRNASGQTIASVYSVRPRPGAPVSVPITWDEVGQVATVRSPSATYGTGSPAMGPVRPGDRRWPAAGGGGGVARHRCGNRPVSTVGVDSPFPLGLIGVGTQSLSGAFPTMQRRIPDGLQTIRGRRCETGQPKEPDHVSSRTRRTLAGGTRRLQHPHAPPRRSRSTPAR